MAEVDIVREQSKWRRDVENGTIGGGGGASGLPTGYLTGLVTAINVGSPLTDIDIGTGAARSSDDQEDIRLTSALTKELDNVWVAGTGVGGRASGAALAADTWYHMFVITNGTDVDAGFDTSISATNLLADSGYTQFRRIGSVLTNGSSEIISYIQNGSEFRWSSPREDFNGVLSASRVLQTLSVPVDVKVNAIISPVVFSSAGTSRYATVVDPDQDDEVSTEINAVTISSDSVSNFLDNSVAQVRTNTSSEVAVRSNSTPTARISTFGWIDPRSEFQSGGTGQVQRATSSEYCPGYTFTFVDTDTWRITGINAENLFNVGRRLKFIDGASTYFGTVTAVDYNITSANDTTIDMSMESGDVLTNTITEVCLVTGATAWSPITDDPFSGTPIRAIATGVIGGVQHWIIVGDAGRLASSTDGGLNWTVRSTGVAANFDDVAYNADNETFIAVARGGELVRSSNGTTWATPTNDLTSVVTTGTGECYITWDPETANWCIIIDRIVNNFASYSGPDSSNITWTLRETGMGLGQRSLEYYGYTGVALEELVIAQNDDVVVLDNAQDTTSIQRYSNIGQQIQHIIGVYDTGDVPPTDRWVTISTTGEVECMDANGAGTFALDNVTFTAQLNEVIYSPLHDRLVVVGNNANLGYMQGDETTIADNWTFVASGFGPLVNILCVDWNESDGIFIAGGEDGTICRSSNGTN